MAMYFRNSILLKKVTDLSYVAKFHTQTCSRSRPGSMRSIFPQVQKRKSCPRFAFQMTETLPYENSLRSRSRFRSRQCRVRVKYSESMRGFGQNTGNLRLRVLISTLRWGGSFGIVYFFIGLSITKHDTEADPCAQKSRLLRGVVFNIWSSVQAITPNLGKRNFIADVVEKAGPAVVFIEVKGKHPTSGRRVTLSNGSGFLVRSSGLILTNAHVVANKSSVSVKLYDGRVLEGHVTAVDPVFDLATLQIHAGESLPVIPLGKTSNIRPGEFVVAMGSPLSLSNTVTSGIISSSLRESKELGLKNENLEYIQTDAVISFGNSGGPLVNLDGKAIGINTMKVATGISFAIPADYAMQFLQKAEKLTPQGQAPSYMTNGKESQKKRYMGITMLTLTPEVIPELQSTLQHFPEVNHGVYVHRVIVGSPAYISGLHAGDIITEINGVVIKSAVDVYQMVEKSSKLDVLVLRGANSQHFKVVTEEIF